MMHAMYMCEDDAMDYDVDVVQGILELDQICC